MSPSPADPQPRPTDRELEILSVLWSRGESTVREVHETLADQLGIGQTTVLKLMQIMVEKGLIMRDESVRPQRFTAAQPKASTQRQLIGDLVDRAFSGAAAPLVMEALAGGRVNEAERDRIRQMLDQLDARDQDEARGANGGRS